MKKNEGNSRKLGPIVELTGHEKDYGFTFSKRKPGSMPDMLDNSEGANNGDQRLLVEEAIKHAEDNKGGILGFVPFKTPSAYVGTTEYDFLEPGEGSNCADWNRFNKWILGDGLHPKDKDEPNDFTEFLRELAVRCRHHNAALYSLRRLHYKLTAPEDSEKMKNNPNGDSDDKVDTLEPSDVKFKTRVAEAEARWTDATRKLRDKIRDEVKLNGKWFTVIADLVEVNGYIVSMRVVATRKPTDEKSPFFEYTGISSSHISISSAFSSYSSP